MKKIISVILIGFSFLWLLGTAQLEIQDGATATTMWGGFFLFNGAATALWISSNRSAERRQAKLIADAIKKSNE
jgi:hypothetical protein